MGNQRRRGHQRSDVATNASGRADGGATCRSQIITTDQPIRHPDRDRNDDGLPENARPRDRFGAPLPRDAPDELGDRVEPEDVCASVGQALERAIELFDQQRFFESHEFFEWAWKGPMTPDADRDFYKGLAQLAVGYTHTQRGNAVGAASLLERAVSALAPWGPQHNGVDVARAAADAAHVLTLIDDHGPGPDIGFPRFPTADTSAGPSGDGGR